MKKKLLDMLILNLKKLIIKDKTITLKGDKFNIDIDDDMIEMSPTEIVKAFIDKYNEVNSTKL